MDGPVGQKGEAVTMSTREQARLAVSAEATAAATKMHQRNYHRLHVWRDGTVSWHEAINQSDDIIDREADGFAPVASVALVGTGSMRCNCDFCDCEDYVTRDEAVAAAVEEFGNWDIEQMMLEDLDAIVYGYFNDEREVA